jgi:hypothetical protein
MQQNLLLEPNWNNFPDFYDPKKKEDKLEAQMSLYRSPDINKSS